MNKIIAIINRKGGSEKTTTAKSLACDLTLNGKHVLLIDLDPQCNATEGLTSRKYNRTAIGILEWISIRKCIYKARFKDLDILPGNDYLASIEVQDDILIKQVLPIREDYDHIVTDTSPYFNKLTAEILKISDLVITPTLLEDDPTRGVITTTQELMALFGESTRCRVLATMVDRNEYAENLFTALKEDIGTLCFDIYTRENRIPVRGTRQYHAPLSYRHRYTLKAARDCKRLTKEILEVIWYGEEKHPRGAYARLCRKGAGL